MEHDLLNHRGRLGEGVGTVTRNAFVDARYVERFAVTAACDAVEVSGQSVNPVASSPSKATPRATTARKSRAVRCRWR
jgi:hypothetical protein